MPPSWTGRTRVSSTGCPPPMRCRSGSGPPQCWFWRSCCSSWGRLPRDWCCSCSVSVWPVMRGRARCPGVGGCSPSRTGARRWGGRSVTCSGGWPRPMRLRGTRHAVRRRPPSDYAPSCRTPRTGRSRGPSSPRVRIMDAPAEMLLIGLDEFTDTLAQVTDPEAPSPCEGWRAVDVAGHVVGTMGKVVALVSDGAVGDSPTDPEQVGLTPVTMMARWGERAQQVRDALADADLSVERETSYGRGPVGRQLLLPASDLAIHVWDLAASQGVRRELPQELRDFLRAGVERIPPERMRAPGMFGPETTPPADANETERIMAFLGRTVPR
ncbi:TIGR03086 family protein [Enemella evansiae]|nr:TIGR03086 family protein [Enemella evansiae]